MNLTLAILRCKCPQCRRGNMFEYGAYNLAKYNKLKEKCQQCDAKFVPEPGFYIGAMYFSYAINVGIMLPIFLTTRLVFNPEPLWVYFAAVLIPVFLFFPLNFRLSRALMLHFFGGIDYKPLK